MKGFKLSLGRSVVLITSVLATYTECQGEKHLTLPSFCCEKNLMYVAQVGMFPLFPGVTNRETIQANVRRAIAGKFPLYCLGFGFDVSFEFLQKLSLTNNGVARRIYEDADADLQLKVFPTKLSILLF